mmetsp:Transcript_4351/g.10814  ORF Transcript_4351/g.10814 Transcript_4351/m.10814 type:complete len:100 (-) Transcript_4351:363-662(-)
MPPANEEQCRGVVLQSGSPASIWFSDDAGVNACCGRRCDIETKAPTRTPTPLPLWSWWPCGAAYFLRRSSPARAPRVGLALVLAVPARVLITSVWPEDK